MRTSLKTTTAVLACLNLAIPSQSFAQAEPGAEGSESVCVTDPTSQACRDLIAQETGGEDGSQADGAETENAPETDSAPESGAETEAAPESEAGGAAGGEMPEAEGGSAGASEEAAPAAEDDAAADAPADAIPDDAVAGDEDESSGGAEEAPEAPASDPAGAPPETPSEPGEDPAASDEEAQPSEVESGEQKDAPSAAQDDTQSVPTDESSTAPEDMPGSDAAPSTTQDDAADAEPDEAQGSETEAAPEETPPAPQQAAPGDGASPEAQSQSDAQGNGSPAPDAQTQTDEGAQTPEDDGARSQADENAPAQADDGAETGGQAPTEDAQSDMPSDEGPQDTAEPAAPQSESSQDPAQPPAQSAEGQPSEAPTGQGGGGLSALEAGDATDAEEVTTETVTEESSRSSSEDFTSGIDQSPEAEDDGGLSNLERALLLGAGALAVGAIVRGGREVVASSDDRVVVSGSDGGYQLIKDDDALLRQPGSEVRTQTFDDGSTRTVVMREDGSQIVTIRDAELRVVRRARIMPDGQEILLIDDTETSTPVDTSALTASAETRTYAPSMDEDALRAALSAQQGFDRSYSLSQIRSTEQVRAQVPAIDLETITFASGSAAITPEQADELTQLGQFIADRVEENPREIFLVEGHTDAVGDAAYNLALSDRRAESVALALTEYFSVPPENLVVQGYGEQFLKVQTEAAEQANRRATLRQITPLLQAAAAGR